MAAPRRQLHRITAHHRGRVPPLIIAGMHRSGTSLVASLAQTAGVDLGGRLLPGDRFNPRGYFEDVEFLEFDRRLLSEASSAHAAGWPDWGWTELERLDGRVFDRYLAAATGLIGRRERHEPWGWKDPRSSLLLWFWAMVVPGAR